MKRRSLHRPAVLWPFWTLIGFLFCLSCEDETDYDRSASHLPSFSADTLRMDTVFSTIPSASFRLAVYNHHRRRLEVDADASLLLQHGFSVLADGVDLADKPVARLTVEGKDSVVFFVSLTAPLQHADTPVALEVPLRFVCNGEEMSVPVAVDVQDVHVVQDKYLASARWSGVKPYLLKSSLTVEDLILEEGVTVCLHQAADLRVTHSLSIEGTKEHPVRLCGDRPERAYRRYPGQWGSLVLDGDGTTYRMTFAEIRNGTNGVLVDLPHGTGRPSVTLSSCRILNMSDAGILNRSGDLAADNVLIANCGYYTLACTGGSCRLQHSTLANNYSRYMIRHGQPAVWLQSSGLPEEENRYSFFNTLVYGTLSEEIGLDASLGDTEVLFDHCLVRTLRDVRQDVRFNEVKTAAVSPFMRPSDEDFSLSANSPARDMASMTVAAALPADLAGNDRLADGAPDAGALEYQGR